MYTQSAMQSHVVDCNVATSRRLDWRDHLDSGEWSKK